MIEFLAFVAGVVVGAAIVIRGRAKTYQHMYEAGWREGWESAVNAAKAYTLMRKRIASTEKQTPDQPLN